MITKEQLKDKVMEMIPQVTEGMEKNLARLIADCESVVSLDDYEDNYLLPKMLLMALLQEEMFQYKTFSATRKEQLKCEKLINLLYTLL